MKSPLDGVTVIDFTRVLAGPYCTMILADMGARVIKVERPGVGDDSRKFGPPFVNGESAFFLSINRNKESLTVNLKKEEGKRIIHGLVKNADVVVENFRPKTMKKLGLDYESLKKINPAIIYAAVSGFGQTGQYKCRAGYDVLIQAMAATMSLTGAPDGPPYKVGISIADMAAGMNAVQGILAALYVREKTGIGQMIDVSLFETMISLLTFQAGKFFATGRSPQRIGNRHPTICPYEPFPASDDVFILAVGNDRAFERLCRVLKMDLDRDARFETNEKRVENADALFDILSGIFIEKPKTYWMDLFERNGVPSGPILDVEGALSLPPVAERNMIVSREHETAGVVKSIGLPIKFSDCRASYRKAPPVLGADTQTILSEMLKMDENTINDFYNNGII